jgi:hypothetical protein
MNTSNQVMAWGEEITPLEMQNTKGGGVMDILIGIGLIDFLYRLGKNGGDPEAAAEAAGKDITAMAEFILKLLGLTLAK